MKTLLFSYFMLVFAVVGMPTLTAEEQAKESVMEGFPPTQASQATMSNYLQIPYSQWAFANAGAPLNVVMIPRQGKIFELTGPTRPALGNFSVSDAAGKTMAFEDLFAQNYADGLVVVQGEELLYEKYFRHLDAHGQHIWFSMSKSLASTALGLLVEAGKIDLSASPTKYIPELKGSGFDRVTVQHVLDMASSIDFNENYTDVNSDFLVHYAPALNLVWLKGAADVKPGETQIYGVHDFLTHFIKPDLKRQPGDNFDYNSSNADVLGWLISRVSGQPFQDYIQQNIWSKIGAEHDAYIAVDRAFMPAVTGGMNSTTRDAARFGMMIRDNGQFNGEQIIPARWVKATLDITDKLSTI
tara:strand:- start:291 stop:1358 length:1068 start_codon:yes stop_codon:yes gene_type:complete